MMDAYTFGAFAVAVVGILALVWMILRAITILSLAKPPTIQPTILRPMPPREEPPTEPTWPRLPDDQENPGLG